MSNSQYHEPAETMPTAETSTPTTGAPPHSLPELPPADDAPAPREQASSGHTPASSPPLEPSPLSRHNTKTKNRTKRIALLSSCGAVAAAITVTICLIVWAEKSQELPVPTLADIPAISNNEIHYISVSGTMRIKSDNSLWDWETKIIDDVAQVSAGDSHTMPVGFSVTVLFSP